MDHIPPWIQFWALTICLLLAVEGSYRLRARLSRSRASDDSGPAGGDWSQVTTPAALTIMGLMLAFTVSMAVDHYEGRRKLVVDEANAISTTYLRAQLLDEPARGRLSALIEIYARDRGLIFDAGDVRASIDKAEATTDADQRALWAATAEVLHEPGNATWAVLFVNAMNQMFDLAETRHASLEARIPPRVVRVSVLYSFVSALMVGYGLAPGSARHRIGAMLTFVMIAVILGLIMDLDHPRSGAIQVPEGPLQRVTAAIVQAQAAKPHAVAIEPGKF